MFRKLWIHRAKKDYALWAELLQENGLKTERNVDEVYGLFEGEHLLATAALFGSTLKCVAVKDQYQGGTVFHNFLSQLIELAQRKGHKHLFLYTKVATASAFENLGFCEIARVENKLVFMERGPKGIFDFLSDLKQRTPPLQNGPIAALVLNANPFTLGHRGLIEYAAKENAHLYLFLVQEDRSLFSYQTRKELLKKGTLDLQNVTLLETGPYLVSSATFPAYFLKEDEDLARIQATLDALVFLTYFVPAFNLDRRYLGTEPLSPVTELYNRAMAEVFKGHLDLRIVPRFEHKGQVISASRVRQLLLQGKLEEIKALVPPTTYKYLMRPEVLAHVKGLR